MTRRPSAALAAVVLGATFTFAACGGSGSEVSSDGFCKRVQEQQQMILNPPLGTDAEIAATLEFYQLMGQLAPVAISEQWQSMVTLVETASTVVPSDPESVQRMAKQAYATELPAYEISVWVKRNCGVDLPVATIVPHDVGPAGDTSGVITVAPSFSVSPNATVAPNTIAPVTVVPATTTPTAAG